MTSFKQLFLLDPDIVFLNHGSYGATPRPVFEAYQDWQRRLEREPIRFLTRELPRLLYQAREALGRYVNADADDLVYIPNATFGINVVARSLPLQPGDQVLATNHEYGAVDNAWSSVCRRRGASYIKQPVTYPATSATAIAEELWRGVTPRTKVLFFSHITSPTALRLPAETLCERARAANILTVIDGAHAPGQIPLDLTALDADFYVANCHKWLCSPKGAAFLHTRRDRQPLIEPLVVGWGWGENRKPTSDSAYVDSLQWLGTHDPSAYLAVPAAIDFQKRHRWPEVREQCRRLLEEALARIAVLTGHDVLYPDHGGYYEQMAVTALPPINDLAAFNGALFDKYKIEIPCVEWGGRQFLRISVQAYNTEGDLDALVSALEMELPGDAAHRRGRVVF